MIHIPGSLTIPSLGHVFGALHAVFKGLALDVLLKRPPIVIGGCERSGTTLLHRMISAHPKVIAIPEETWSLCYSVAAGFAGNRPIRRSRLWRALGNAPANPGATRWSEKSPANIYHFDDIRRSFNGFVQFIQIVRDGRDVVTSSHPQAPDRPWVPPQRWIESVRVGLHYLGDFDVLTVRYEDLITQTRGSIERICAFLEEETVPEIFDWYSNASVGDTTSGKIRPISNKSIGKWKKPGARWTEQVDALSADPEAQRLLDLFGYLGEPHGAVAGYQLSGNSFEESANS